MGAALSSVIESEDNNNNSTNTATTSGNIVERAGIKADDREIEELSQLVSAAAMHFDSQYIRQNDAEIMQATVAAVELFVNEIKASLNVRWDKACDGQEKCYLMGILVRIVTECIEPIITFSLAHVEKMLCIVAEAEVDLLNISAGAQGRHPVAKGASNRSRAKLLLQERSEKVVAKVKASLKSFGENFNSNKADSHVDIIVRGALLPLDSSKGQQQGGSSGTTTTTSFSVTRSVFLEHVASLVLQCVDTATLVEHGAFLRLVPAVLGGNSGSGGTADKAADMSSSMIESLSARVCLHANRLVALSEQKSLVSGSPSKSGGSNDAVGVPPGSWVGGQTKEETKYEALVISTPAELQQVLNDREAQLTSVITEIHNYACLPALHSTITNPAGSHVIEFDAVQEQTSSFRMHNHSRSDLAITKFGRYLRVSPAVLLLMVLTRTTNGVVEHFTETIHLVREDFAPDNNKTTTGNNNAGGEGAPDPAEQLYKQKYGYGWRDMSSGVLYDTVIPNNDGAAAAAASGALQIQTSAAAS